VGVPDLERIGEVYLSKLKGALNGDDAAAHDYDWITLELIDQIVRYRRRSRLVALWRLRTSLRPVRGSSASGGIGTQHERRAQLVGPRPRARRA